MAKGDIEGVKIRHLSCKSDCVLAVSDEGDLFGYVDANQNTRVLFSVGYELYMSWLNRICKIGVMVSM